MRQLTTQLALIAADQEARTKRWVHPTRTAINQKHPALAGTPPPPPRISSWVAIQMLALTHEICICTASPNVQLLSGSCFFSGATSQQSWPQWTLAKLLNFSTEVKNI